MSFEYSPSLTQSRFIKSVAEENCLMGPRGEGKTEAGIAKMLYHAKQQDSKYLPVRWAIVRDTWTNLQRSTLESFQLPSPESIVSSFYDSGLAIDQRLKISDGGQVVELPGLFRAFLIGCDNIQDLDKFQSLQLGGVWFEEVAPAAGYGEIGSGISELTWEMALTSLRQPLSTMPVAMITMNYPDIDHWSWVRFHDENHPERACFEMRPGENRFLSDSVRQRMRNALSGNKGMLDRLVLGRPAEIVVGESVLSNYSSDFHMAKVKLDPKPYDCVRMWDGWYKCSCIIGQMQPSGQLQILDAIMGHNTDVKQLIRNELIPLITGRYEFVKHWRDIGDPSMSTGDQSDSSQSAARVIDSELQTAFEDGCVEWAPRRDSFQRLLTETVGNGQPKLLVSNHLRTLDRYLRSGWHYHKNQQGMVLRDKPYKDDASHPCDAMSYGIQKMFGYQVDLPTIDLSKYKKRASGYGMKTLIRTERFPREYGS